VSICLGRFEICALNSGATYSITSTIFLIRLEKMQRINSDYRCNFFGSTAGVSATNVQGRAFFSHGQGDSFFSHRQGFPLVSSLQRPVHGFRTAKSSVSKGKTLFYNNSPLYGEEVLVTMRSKFGRPVEVWGSKLSGPLWVGALDSDAFSSMKIYYDTLIFPLAKQATNKWAPSTWLKWHTSSLSNVND